MSALTKNTQSQDTVVQSEISVFVASNCSVRVWLCGGLPACQPSQFLNNTQRIHRLRD